MDTIWFPSFFLCFQTRRFLRADRREVGSPDLIVLDRCYLAVMVLHFLVYRASVCVGFLGCEFRVTQHEDMSELCLCVNC